MAIEYLKRGASASSRREEDAKVRATVEAILADIEARGDAAVRDYSERFDQLHARELPARGRRDRRARRAGARRATSTTSASPRRRCGASPRRSAPRCTDIEVETLPGVILGHKQHPGAVGRLLRAGRQVPDGRLGAHVGASPPRSPACRASSPPPPPFQGEPQPGDRRGHAPRRRARDLRARRHAGGRRDGARHRDDRARRHAGRPRQRLRRRGQAPALRPRRHRPLRRADRDHGDRRRDRRRRALRHRPARPGRARLQLAGRAGHQLPTKLAEADAGRDRPHPGDPADRRDRARQLARLWRGDRLRQLRGDAGGRQRHRLRARAGDDRPRRLVPREHAHLRRAVPRRRAPTSPTATR